MLTQDYDRFKDLLARLGVVFGKSLDDVTAQIWWKALRDLPFEQVSERIDAHIRYAKFFPKPMEIRPKEEKPKSSPDPYFEPTQRKSDAHWDELWRTDREEWLRCVSPKIYEAGRAKGMSDAMIASKLASYIPLCAGRPTN